jgi:hypothetical protein
MLVEGNVGIGTTTNTAYKLQVNGTTSIGSSDGGEGFLINLGSTGTIKGGTAGANDRHGYLHGDGNKNIVLLNQEDGMITMGSGNVGNGFCIDTNNNVGIGTTNPGYKLHIVNPTLDNSIQDLLCLETHSSTVLNGPALLFRERWNYGSYWNLARIAGLEQSGYGGQLAFYTNQGSTSGDDTLIERMRIDKNGNVGIGTTNPLSLLHIETNGSNAGTSEGDEIGSHNEIEALRISSIGDAADVNAISSKISLISDTNSQLIPHGKLLFYLNYSANDDNNWGYTPDNMVMSLVGSGNVGIGTTNPQTQLAVKGSDDGGISIIRSADNFHWRIFNSDSNSLTFQGRNSDNSIRSNCDDLLVLNDGGKVGIGTNNPYQKLQVNGNILLQGTDDGYKESSSKYIGVSSDDGDVGISGFTGIAFKPVGSLQGAAGYNSHLEFYTYNTAVTSGSPRMTIRNDGNVGIGTTNPNFPLEIKGSTTATAGSSGVLDTGGARTAYASNDSIGLKVEYAIWSESIILASSDRRIKENIVDVSDNQALSMLRNIPSRYYEYIDKLGRGNEKTIGFIAQEVKEVLPMAVSLQKVIIPNEYRSLSDISWNNTTLYTDLSDCSGVKYRFYVSNDLSGNDKTMKEVIGNKDNSFTFDQSYNNVFCYGREVDDFHTLDKQKLFALNFSATQELDRIQQQQVIDISNANATIQTLQTDLSNANTTIQQQATTIQQQATTIQTLETQIADILTRLSNLENTGSA